MSIKLFFCFRMSGPGEMVQQTGNEGAFVPLLQTRKPLLSDLQSSQVTYFRYAIVSANRFAWASVSCFRSNMCPSCKLTVCSSHEHVSWDEAQIKSRQLRLCMFCLLVKLVGLLVNILVFHLLDILVIAKWVSIPRTAVCLQNASVFHQ